MTSNYKIIISCCLAFILFAACTQKDFDDNFKDPEKSSKGDIPRLFTGMLYNVNQATSNTIMPRYMSLYAFQLPMPGKYSQQFGYTASAGRYEQQTAYTQTRWKYFYTGPFASYIEMNKIHESLTNEEDKKGYELFIQLAKVFIYDQAAQMVDIWGDLPFSEAGFVISSGGNIKTPKYDDQKGLYIQFIDDLKNIADYLNAYQHDPMYTPMLNKADIINAGDLLKWKIYTNSLRFRLAMRMSFADEAKSKEVVTEILNNPAKYPMVSELNNIIKIDAKGNELRAVIGVEGIKKVFESNGYNYAPGHIINNLMLPSKDPRLPVLFSKTPTGTYLGLDPNLDPTVQDDLITNNRISRIDTATFTRNDQFPGIIITAAEISFLKAEANERWGIGTAANDHYEKGIRQSIQFWYYVNHLNNNADQTAFVPKTPPTEKEIATFLTHEKIAYVGSKEAKLEKIATQNWANFSPIQSVHAWAEYRRTKFPKLTFNTDGSSPQSVPPTRLLYPENERTYNPDNYAKVKDKDKTNVRVFWDVK